MEKTLKEHVWGQMTPHKEQTKPSQHNAKTVEANNTIIQQGKEDVYSTKPIREQPVVACRNRLTVAQLHAGPMQRREGHEPMKFKQELTVVSLMLQVERHW